MKKIFSILTLFAFALPPSLEAAVYDTRSGGGGHVNASAFLNAQKVLSEPVEINGVRLTLELGRSHRRWSDFELAVGRKNLSERGMYLERAGGRRRILVLGFGPGIPVLEFAMELPARFPSSFAWPRALVLPGGCEPLRYYYFPNRGAYYGEVRGNGEDRISMLREAAGLWIGRGFRAVSGELARGGENISGELFLNTRTREIAWSATTDDGRLLLFVRKWKGAEQ